jgi:FeS assembly SUF system regulator
MLRLSKLADYATVIMTFLAQHPQNNYSARGISEVTRLPVTTVSKILKRLCGAQLLLSIRGSRGGYRLAYPSSQISLAQIINAMEDDVAVTECSTDHSHCQFQQYCAVSGNWQLISRALGQALASISLADLAQPISDISLTLQHKDKVYPVAENGD